MSLISGEYVEQLKAIHASREWGASGYSHAPVVALFRRELNAKTILDYGCGRATLKGELTAIDPEVNPEWISEYDPAIHGKDGEPSPADLLVCTDVLEHIERDYLEETLLRLRALARKGAYFTIALTPSKVSLPDGRNAHLIIKPIPWWREKLEASGFQIARGVLKKGYWVWAR